jgi:hypothetical protein
MENHSWHFPNFELVEIWGELGMLGSYSELLDEHLKYAIERERAAFQTKLQANPAVIHDEEDWAVHQAELDELDYTSDVYLPRLFRGPFIVTLWGVFESAVLKLADLLKKKQRQALSITDFGGSILVQARKYYDHILHFELCDSQGWERLRDLYLLRNAFAHSNGYVAMIRDPDKVKKLRRLIKRRNGLSEVFGHILMTKEFVAGEHTMIEEIVRGMLHRYEEM